MLSSSHYLIQIKCYVFTFICWFY